MSLLGSKLSRGEAVYIRQGIEQNVRNDGRARTDYRYFNVKTGVVVTARGSAQVRLGGSCVIAAINLELFTPEAVTPNEGKLSCSVDCTANASDEFEGKGADIKNAALTSDLERILVESKCVDLSKLVVVSGKACWNVSIDALVMDAGGNLLDTICLAVRAALANTIIPRMEVTVNEDGVPEIGDPSDDPTDGEPFPVDSVPICVSIAKIGSCFVVDPSEEEEQCMAALVTVAVSNTGDVCGVHKRGPGGLAPSALAIMIKSATEVGKGLHDKLSQAKVAPLRRGGKKSSSSSSSSSSTSGTRNKKSSNKGTKTIIDVDEDE